MMKCNFSWIIVYVCVVICFVMSILICKNMLNSNFIYIASIGKNWVNGPITEIELGGFDCPFGKESIFKEYWEGTNTGCLCGSSYSDLGSSQCSSSDEDHHDCRDILEIKPIEIKVWKGTKICGKRNENYLNLKTAKNPLGCEMGYKPCGIIDTLNNVLCYPDRKSCPYNGMKMIRNGDDVPKDKNYTIIPLGLNGKDGKILFTNENYSGRIINQFKFEDDIPCISPEYHNRKFTPYKLEKFYDKNQCSVSINGRYYDDSFIKVDTENYSRLYSENNILNVLKILPFFEENFSYSDQPISLFYKNYIGVNTKCRKETNDSGIGENEAKKLINLENIFNSIFIFQSIVVFICLSGMIFVIFSSINYLSAKDESVISFSSNVLGIFFYIPMLIISIVIISKINSTSMELSFFQDPDCIDQTTSVAVSNFSSMMISAKSNIFMLFVFSVIGLGSSIYNLASQ